MRMLVVALVAGAALCGTACGAPDAPAASDRAVAAPAASARPSGGDDLDCPGDERQVLVLDYEMNPDGGKRSPRTALRRHLDEGSTVTVGFPPAQHFGVARGHISQGFVEFEYLDRGQRLAVVWVSDLGRSWLETAHEVREEALDR